MYRLNSISGNIPIIPKLKIYFQYLLVFKPKDIEAAIIPPKCQLPSIIISVLPLYFAGINSSIAANIAVY
jgi:hypothetical protein